MAVSLRSQLARLRAVAGDRRAWLAVALGAIWMPVAHGSATWAGGILPDGHPLRLSIASRIRAGELPLWSDRVGAGASLFSLTQPGVFDPLGLIAVMVPGPLGVDLARLAAHVLLALGARRWFLALGAEDDDATAGAAVAALSGFTVSLVFATSPGAAGLAWVPWALAELAAPRDDRRRAVALGAVFLALPLLAGDAQSWLIAALLGLAQALGAPAADARRRSLGELAAALALGLALGAAQVLPALSSGAAPWPWAAPADPAWRASLSPRRVIELLAPEFFGEPFTDRWYLQWLYRSHDAEPFAAGIYLGAATIPLAAAAALRRSRARVDVALTLGGAAAVVLALGDHLPLGSALRRALGPFAGVHRPEAYLGATTLAAAALVARALPDARRRVDLAARVTGTLSLAMLVVAAVMFQRGSRLARRLVPSMLLLPGTAHDVVLTAAGHGAAWLLALHAVALMAQHGRVSAAGARAAACALVVLDLAVNALPLALWTNAKVYTAPSPLIAAMRAESRGEAPIRVLRLVDHRIRWEPEAPTDRAAMLHPNLGVQFGVAHIDPSIPAGDRRAAAVHALARPRTERAMKLHGARFLIATGRVIDIRAPSLRFAALLDDGPWNLAVDDAPGPVAYVAARVIPARDEAHGRALAYAEEFSVGADLALEGGEARGAQGRCALTRHGPERVSLACDASAPSYAVLADAHAPGWTATVDGRAAPILRANGAFRAVPIPAGVSRVEMRYAAPGLAPGLGVSAASLAAVALLRRRRRRDA